MRKRHYAVLLSRYGSVFIGTASLRELARHIGDRDNAVRSAALNALCDAYFLEGERLYKMIGQVAVYGSVFIGTASLRELARHIGDRDNAVRSAALNALCDAYFLEGERLYKMIGQVAVHYAVLLSRYGSVFIGTASLRELARHIGDRDNAVRSAALNALCDAYFLEGERLYKMIGQVASVPNN
ncbi:unnamed protein product [Plutella xylostella]|uniref:(diamondback moth) hypothetical protein n=1 Tax=Plutella xylostella TaxID=51655 RepID=A0A8S4G7R2_PLUXY|nr:unnamed protein product [Plutella xylostella]